MLDTAGSDPFRFLADGAQEDRLDQRPLPDLGLLTETTASWRFPA
jgi:hypothetical protein